MDREYDVYLESVVGGEGKEKKKKEKRVNI